MDDDSRPRRPERKPPAELDQRFEPRGYVPDTQGVPRDLNELFSRHIFKRLKSQTMTGATMGAAALFLGPISAQLIIERSAIVSAFAPPFEELFINSLITVFSIAFMVVAGVGAFRTAKAYNHTNLGTKICLLLALISTALYFQDRFSALEYGGALLVLLFFAILIEGSVEGRFAGDAESETVLARAGLAANAGLPLAIGALVLIFLLPPPTETRGNAQIETTPDAAGEGATSKILGTALKGIAGLAALRYDPVGSGLVVDPSSSNPNAAPSAAGKPVYDLKKSISSRGSVKDVLEEIEREARGDVDRPTPVPFPDETRTTAGDLNTPPVPERPVRLTISEIRSEIDKQLRGEPVMTPVLLALAEQNAVEGTVTIRTGSAFGAVRWDGTRYSLSKDVMETLRITARLFGDPQQTTKETFLNYYQEAHASNPSREADGAWARWTSIQAR